MQLKTFFLRRAVGAALFLLSAVAAIARDESSVVAPDPGSLTEVEVTARRLDAARNGLMPETGSSLYRIDEEDLRNLPLGESTPLNEVLLRAPGVVQDSFGQLHVRGDHANLQYRINDVVIPESIALFGQSLSPRFASDINLLTGALPAQYGYRTAGVVDIHTKGSNYPDGGEIGIHAGSHGYLEADGELSGHAGDWSYYVTLGHLANNLGIENPTAANTALHDHTEQWNGFANAARVLADGARLSFIAGVSNDDFEIPDNPGRVAAYAPPGANVPRSDVLDERQHEDNRYAIVAYENASDATIHYQIALYDRVSNVHYQPDVVGDLAYTGASGDVARSNERWGMQFDASLRSNGAHVIRFGVTYNDETARTAAHTTVYPLSADGSVLYDPLALADLSRTGVRFWGLYLQDEWHPFSGVTVNYGARYDTYEGLTREDQLSPRFGVVWELDSRTTLHAGYARYFTPPATEKISSETVALFANTTGAPPSEGNDPVRSERSHYFDLGVSTKLSTALTLGLDGYFRSITDLADEGQFGPALLFAPFNYERGRIYGVESTLSWRSGGTSAYLNGAWGRATGQHIVSGQYNFGPDELQAIAAQAIPLDHDQRVTGSAGVSRTIQGIAWSLDAVGGTGLRRGYLNADHLPSYLTFNLAARKTFLVAGLGELEFSVSLVNLADRIYELRDGSGVGVGAPQWGQRRTVYLGLSRSFGR